jgi:ABC-type transport system involved in multi-copper enzyme maturation permease subunit
MKTSLRAILIFRTVVRVATIGVGLLILSCFACMFVLFYANKVLDGHFDESDRFFRPLYYLRITSPAIRQLPPELRNLERERFYYSSSDFEYETQGVELRVSPEDMDEALRIINEHLRNMGYDVWGESKEEEVSVQTPSKDIIRIESNLRGKI